MKRSGLKKSLFAFLVFIGSINICAQQTLSESNLLKDAVEIYARDAVLTDAEALCDGNDMTIGKIESTEGTPSLIVKFAEAVNIGAVNLVAGKDMGMTPKQVYVYVRNSDDEEWKMERRIMSLSFPLPFVNFVSGVTSKPYRQYKVEMRNIADGGKTVTLAELQLLGEAPARSVLGKVNSSSLDKNYFDNGVIGESAWGASVQYDFEEPTAVAGYSLGWGSGNKNNRPRAWELSGSDDGENWVSLDMRSNQPQLGGENFATDYYFGKTELDMDFGKVADEIHSVLSHNFIQPWGNGTYLLNSWSGNPDLINRGYNYWWMAHAVDAYVDAYARMGNRLYQSRAFQIKEGMYTAYNGGRQDLFNDYNDDMEWMCIACCHAYGSFTADKSKWLAEAVQLFDWIWQSWDESTGGILWTVGSQRGVLSSKNSCSNAPAMICANYLYEITGDESYLQKSKMIFDFMSEHSLFDDGFVKDGPENDNRGWAFTYNQGTWIGGLMGLYKATGEQKYYDIAVDLIDKSIDSRWYSPNGILCESGKGDGGLFKGIYIRYITEWVLSGLLDENRKMRYANYLLENARSLYLSALIKPDFTIMANWQDRGESSLETYDSSVVLSGLFLLEGVDKLRRAGILTDNYTLNNPSHGKPFRHYRLNVTANYGGNKVDINSFSLLGEHAGSGVTDITMPETDAGYEVYNLTGNKVGKNITNLVPGIYVIKSSITTSKKVIR